MVLGYAVRELDRVDEVLARAEADLVGVAVRGGVGGRAVLGGGHRCSVTNIYPLTGYAQAGMV
jgi:hypothetical protein